MVNVRRAPALPRTPIHAHPTMMFSFVFLVSLFALVACDDSETELLLSTVHLPRGFAITKFASGMTKPRSLTHSSSHNITYVGSMGTEVYAVRRVNGAAQVMTLASGLNAPNGVAYDAVNDTLFVAENAKLYAIDNADQLVLAGNVSTPRESLGEGGDASSRPSLTDGTQV